MQTPVTRRRLLVSGLLALGLAAASWLPVEAAAQAGGLEQALEHFRQAQAGGDPARARDAFAALAKAAPAEPLAIAYEGAAQTLMGRDAWMPWNKMRHTDAGLERIDQALALLKPEHERQVIAGAAVAFAVRVTAASTFLAVPDGIFHRRAAGKKLLAQLQSAPGLASAPAEARAAVLYVAARAARAEDRTADERQALDQALALAPGGFDAEQARKRLKEIAK